ncbi:hypothetical protein EF888_06530 [Silicimonas algicola]|uniref:Uncharacterized protein n=1 Tax=Silicimonas algicola TaxID=1826607 RepID=A0A316G336_9RHOB|nr:hypothetical protein [Silicimonas algicola]AZQ66825.1 hypothetical protein EF888_06530 [Silicimonas algicola]PWK55269.1 hypothetical protein C8D95_108148 [Silicimonas algicola]
MYDDLSVPQRAALLCGMRGALGLELGDEGPLGPLGAFAEAVAFSDDLPAVLMLAEAIDTEIRLFNVPHCYVNADALRKKHGGAATVLALRIAGCQSVARGTVTVWRKGDAGQNDPTLTLDGDLLSQWIRHYQ